MPRAKSLFEPGDIVLLDFPDVQGVKRRPTIVVSTDVYHSARPDIIVGLVTSNTVAAIGPTDYALQDWAAVGLRLPSAFRSFLATIPAARRDLARIGHLTARDWQGVQACLAHALALPTGV
jgi:mRNA interferase MazF